MRSPGAVTNRGVSLLAADPGLGLLLGARSSAALGHRPLLPVLAVPQGDWSPPPAPSLGDGTVALVVLAGALRCRRRNGHTRLRGPGDVLEPWNDGSAGWHACTVVRAAVIGDVFLQAVAPWPAAAARMLRRVGADADGLPVGPMGVAPVADRLGELLWRLAARWGTVAGDGIGLPLALGPAALAGLIGASEPEAVEGLRTLERARSATRRADGTWLMHMAGERSENGLAAARDDLRERLAEGLARARATRALSAELVEEAAEHVRRGAERRRG